MTITMRYASCKKLKFVQQPHKYIKNKESLETLKGPEVSQWKTAFILLVA